MSMSACKMADIRTPEVKTNLNVEKAKAILDKMTGKLMKIDKKKPYHVLEINDFEFDKISKNEMLPSQKEKK